MSNLTATDIAIREQSGRDAEKARQLVEEVFRTNGDFYRLMGPDRLLAAAQVYATLATRGT